MIILIETVYSVKLERKNTPILKYFQAIHLGNYDHNSFDKLTVQDKFKLKNNFENYLIEFLKKSIIQSRNSYKINKQCQKNLREFLDSLLSFEPWSLAGTLLFQNMIF